MTIALGLLLPTREAAIRSRTAPEVLAFARDASDAGFDSLWAGDSLSARPRPEPLTMLAAVAAACDGITVGTAALTAALRHPVLAAHAIGTLDQISGGRLILGLGAGFPYPETQAEFELAGVPFGQRVGRLLEAVRLWRMLWDPERDPKAPLDFAGRYGTFPDIGAITAPARPGGPPLWLAGGGSNALRNAGRFFDGWLPYVPEPEQYGAGLAEARAAMPQGSARGFTPALYATVNVQADPVAARADLTAYTSAYYGLPLEIMETLQASFAGRPEMCVGWLQRFVAAGVEHLIIRIGSLDPASQLETVATEIVPALRET